MRTHRGSVRFKALTDFVAANFGGETTEIDKRGTDRWERQAGAIVFHGQFQAPAMARAKQCRFTWCPPARRTNRMKENFARSRPAATRRRHQAGHPTGIESCLLINAGACGRGWLPSKPPPPASSELAALTMASSLAE